MANVQKQFEQFHEKIRTDFEMNETLREKRDILVTRIKRYLKEKDHPTCDKLDQGSYAMKTGVIPIDRDFDIDTGLWFDFSENDYAAKEVRKWIFEAVDGHTEDVDDRGPCCRVTYSDGYHVDLVSYACWKDEFGMEHCRLAHKTNGWREADPPKLIEHVDKVREPYKNTEGSTKTDQFRRCVRDLRRWDDVRISGESDAKPTGLAFVLLCKNHLSPTRFLDGKPDDRNALENFTRNAAACVGRLTAKKPTPEYEDVLSKLSDDDMEKLKTKLGELRDALVAADKEPDPTKACEILKKQFGDDFPVPPPEDTGKKSSAPAIITSSASA